MNPYLLVAVGAAWLVSCGASYLQGRDDGRNAQIVAEFKAADESAKVRAAASRGAASAIAAMQPRNTTIIQEVQREVREHTFYRDCRHSPDGLRKLNEALTGRRDEPGAGADSMPRTDGAER